MLLLRRFIFAIFLLTQIIQIKPELVGKVVEASDAKAADNVPNPDNELVGVGGLKVATESGSNTGNQGTDGSDPTRINCDSRRPAYVTRTYTYRYMNKRGRPKTFDENRRFWLKPTYVVQYHKLKSDDQKVHYIRRRLYRYPAPSKFRNGAKWKPAGIRKKPGRSNNPKGRRYYCDVVKDKKVISLKKFKAKYPTSFENAVNYKDWAEANGHPSAEVKKKGYYLNFEDKKTNEPVFVFEDGDTKRRESDDEFEDSGDKEPEPDNKPPKLPEAGTFDGVDVSSPDEEADEDEQKNDKGRGRKPEESGNQDKDTGRSEDAGSTKPGSKDKEIGTRNPVKTMAEVPVAADSAPGSPDPVPSSPDASSTAANARSIPSKPASDKVPGPVSPDTSNMTANARSIPSNPVSDKVPVSPDTSNITANASSIPLNQTSDAASQVPGSPDASNMSAKARSIPSNSTSDAASKVPGSPDTSSIAANASSIPSDSASGAAGQITSTGGAKAIPGTPGIGK